MSDTAHRRLGWALGGACLLLVAWLLWRDVNAPSMWAREQVNVDLGLWATRLLIAVLAITPLSVALREPGLRRLRRPLGLGAAGFTAVHAVQYLIYSMAWPTYMIVLATRPYLAIGTAAMMLLLPLAATSTRAAVRKLGPKTWRRLHWLIYPAAILAVLHELMAWTNPISETGAHSLVVAMLLTFRAGAVTQKMRVAPIAQNPWAPRPTGGEDDIGGLSLRTAVSPVPLDMKL